MNPKDKAKELFEKYCYAIKTEQTDSGYYTNVIYAKECASIAVDEIIINFKDIVPFELIMFYMQVKQEINNL